jgi:allantoin racemase
MSARIVVINPNSSQKITDGISAAVEPLRMTGGPVIECLTLAEGPPGIETQAHVESVVGPIQRAVQARDNDAGAFVIACFSDPGLHAARAATKRPVLGIAECGILAALTRGERFGIIAILPTSIPRHLRYVRQMGMNERFAGDRSIGLGVAALGDDAKVLDRMIEVGRALRESDGADVLVMGCAGMARFRDRVQDGVGVPVIEPTQAAVTMALGAVQLGGRN